MAKLAGRIIDKQSGEQVEARVQVLSSGGTFLHPADVLMKVGPGLPFFYCDGAFEVDAPRGVTRTVRSSPRRRARRTSVSRSGVCWPASRCASADWCRSRRRGAGTALRRRRARQ